MLNALARGRLERTFAGRGYRRPGFLPGEPAKPQERYSPTPAMARVDDLNRSIVAAAASQAVDDLAIHRLMFEPVARARRPAVPLTQETL